MLRAIVRKSTTIRSAVIITASVALLLPLPARCVACSSGTADCSRCQTKQSKTATPAPRSCCERHATTSHKATSTSHCLPGVQSKTCGCKMQAPERTFVAAERQTIVKDLVATLPAVQPSLPFHAAELNRIAEVYDDLPPPVPHRILHCSWII